MLLVLNFFSNSWYGFKERNYFPCILSFCFSFAFYFLSCYHNEVFWPCFSSTECHVFSFRLAWVLSFTVLITVNSSLLTVIRTV
jgi:hypothetical protein